MASRWHRSICQLSVLEKRAMLPQIQFESAFLLLILATFSKIRFSIFCLVSHFENTGEGLSVANKQHFNL